MSESDAEVEAVARAIHEAMSRQAIMQYLENPFDADAIARAAIAAMRPTIDRLTARAEAAEARARELAIEAHSYLSQLMDDDRASRARREALVEAARHLEEEADVLDAHRAELITSGTLNGRRVANEALRKRLARDNRVLIEKLLSDAQYLRALIDSEKAPAP